MNNSNGFQLRFHHSNFKFSFGEKKEKERKFELKVICFRKNGNKNFSFPELSQAHAWLFY